MFNSLINRLPFLTRSAIGFTLMATPLFAPGDTRGSPVPPAHGLRQHRGRANTRCISSCTALRTYMSRRATTSGLYVRALEGSDRFSPTMKVFWYTDPGTRRRIRLLAPCTENGRQATATRPGPATWAAPSTPQKTTSQSRQSPSPSASKTSSGTALTAPALYLSRTTTSVLNCNLLHLG